MATSRRAGFSLRRLKPARRIAARIAALEAENAALRRRLEQLDLMLDTVPAMLAYGDAEFHLSHANRVVAKWWGYEKDEVVGKHLNEVMLPGGFETARPFMLEAGKTGQVVTHERTVVGRDGQTRILRQSYAPHIDEGGVVRGYAGVVVDITEERQAEQVLRERAREVAIADERNRLARELHDAATQTIYSAVLIAEALPQVYARNPQEGQRNLVKLRQLTRGALAEMRTLLFELRPWTLEAVPLTRLLEHLRDSLTGRTRVDVEWDVEAECDPPLETKRAVYRIGQEAFNNIVKHARASRVRVTMRCGDGVGRLLIEDDGRGFDVAGVAGDRMGLQIMRERVEGIGGSLVVRSAPDQGTAVEVAWNLGEAADE
jgi:PAS domain S-box-containing protein